MKTIVRKIYAESVDRIDFSNIGCHWTTDETVLAKYDSIMLNGQDSGDMASFYLYATIDDSIINVRATEISNEEHAGEKEVVLLCGEDIVIEEIIDENQTTVASSVPANTGNRVDQWVSNIK